MCRSHTNESLDALMFDLAASISLLQFYDKSKWFRSLNMHLILHVVDQIRDFGPVMGWWSMIFERLQYLLKKKCHSPKKPELTLVKEIVKSEFLKNIQNNESIKQRQQNFVYEYSKDAVI